MAEDSAERPGGAVAYQVLARKYRPGDFSDLIGQEAMVTTLTNAFAHDRIAHAFIMTGVRGVGKTTTARIIAKGLNCERGDKPTIEPCGICDACSAIAEGRHVDVLEMDAASNTGVGDVREIIDSVRYRAASARYKVYIVDEVHMLSNSAFNALLKTLEEPPEHVKFIFATTEIRKVPVTVLSRCQRFDLRRIEPEVMMDHLRTIMTREGGRLTNDALALITRAAEGSVRDALSLLDQALARGRDDEIDSPTIREMLGLADRGRVFDLFEAIMRGDAAGALEELGQQYSDGADPAVILRDLAELTHWLSVLKVNPVTADDPTVSASERDRGLALSGRLAMRVLTRAWQMLLKSLEELPLAPNSMMAAEMAVIRLTHVADLPPPGDLVRRLTQEGAGAAASPAPSGGKGGGTVRGHLAVAERPAGSAAKAVAPTVVPSHGPAAAPTGVPAAAPKNVDPATTLARFASFSDVLAAVKATNFKLFDDVETFVRLVRYRPGMIEFNPASGAPADLSGRLGQALLATTGARWAVIVSDEQGAPTHREAAHKATLSAKKALRDHPLVAAALAVFEVPEDRIDEIITVKPLVDTANENDYLAPVPEPDDRIDIEGDLLDENDPFEEDL